MGGRPASSHFQLSNLTVFAHLTSVFPDAAIERLCDLNVGTTPVAEGGPHERPQKPLLLLPALDLIDEDEGKLRCISVQLSEPCDESGEAFKAGFNTSADIAKERIDDVTEKHPVQFISLDGALQSNDALRVNTLETFRAGRPEIQFRTV